MTTCKTTLKAWLLLTALLCLPALAESGSDPLPSTSELGKLDPGGVETSFNIPAPPQFIPGTPPPPNNDRQKSQIAAKAMAMAAASQQKIACFMMMSEAMKEENKKNSGMMMAMAMQMCAQADQSMAAAMKNDEGRKQVSSADIPKMAELKTTPAALGKDKIKEAEIPKITFNDEVAKTTDMENDIPVAPPPSIPNFAGEPATGKPSTTDDLKDPVTEFTKDPTVAALDAILRPEEKTEESQKAASPSLQGNTGTLAGGAVAGQPAKNGGGKDDAPVIDDKENTESRRKIGSLVTAGTGGNGGGSSEKSGSSFDMAALMEQMMGGPAAEGPGGIGMELIELNSTKEDPPPNLFEYATYRYRKLATEKGAIRRGKYRAVKAPHRATVATASKVWTEAAQKLDTARKASE